MQKLLEKKKKTKKAKKRKSPPSQLGRLANWPPRPPPWASAHLTAQQAMWPTPPPTGSPSPHCAGDRARTSPPNHLVGKKGRGQVKIAGLFAQQKVANCTADEARGPPPGVKRIQEPLDPRALQEGVRIELHEWSPMRRERLTSIAAVAPQIWRPCQSI